MQPLLCGLLKEDVKGAAALTEGYAAVVRRDLGGVAALEVGWGSGRRAALLPVERRRAVGARGVPAVGDDCLDLLDRADLGDDDAVRTGVQHLLDPDLRRSEGVNSDEEPDDGIGTCLTPQGCVTPGEAG